MFERALFHGKPERWGCFWEPLPQVTPDPILKVSRQAPSILFGVLDHEFVQVEGEGNRFQ
ncbi:hypothetical protein M9M90_02585 [Phenylobacterium sp. LH3H17]|uniref:hypothetical protein n=1 Tax=Phenylobacterium sp. LH3H17 TaxID=2903901 RepID=UPI0020C9C29E|nr:hypothetical protein [Phenylobacterium sp. LH3H17]UTP40079.1 hypothetical protein M9M90_02585 [Phenylobacterium sp. LH3H17]